MVAKSVTVIEKLPPAALEQHVHNFIKTNRNRRNESPGADLQPKLKFKAAASLKASNLVRVLQLAFIRCFIQLLFYQTESINHYTNAKQSITLLTTSHFYITESRKQYHNFKL